ncbi:MAG: hypothetical protein K2H71_03845 [Muribaculaceae bacterium]|nr:hypothetical protein [Muribaculaceae bacterium]
MNDIWSSFLNRILGIPGAKINREAYLRKTFSHLSDSEIRRCLSESPAKVVSMAEIEDAASRAINSHTNKATAISAISGIPGGLAMAVAIPADVANYYFHVVAVGQKLGYLYGFPDMVDDRGKLTSDGEIMLTAFIGVMNKVEVAKELVKKIAVEAAKRISEETAIRIVGNIFSKQLMAQAIETVSTKLGTQIAAKGAARGLYKVLPFVSSVICGSITYATFKSQAKRLHEELKNNSVDQVVETILLQ